MSTLATSAPAFEAVLDRHEIPPLRRGEVTTLQVNVGRVCNQACHHCHVEAGPARTESMSRPVAERVLEVLAASPAVEVLDLTGGAPELNPSFRFLVAGARRLGRRVIDRCNLTVLFEPGQEDTPKFLAGHQVEVVASLPCYEKGNVEKQRGRGVYDRSIEGLRRLQSLGYGLPGSPLRLSLVYNPLGPSLPPDQGELEASYRRELRARFGLEFHHLITLTNFPIHRFADELRATGRHEAYLSLLVDRFNPRTVPELMCRSLVSVAYDGTLYDCDFHQMAELPLGAGRRTLWDLENLGELVRAPVATAQHCFACTAGCGASCGGALV